MKLFQSLVQAFSVLPFNLGLAQNTLPCDAAHFQPFLGSDSTILNTTFLPLNSSFGDPSEIAYPNTTTKLPALCMLTINVTSSTTSSYRLGLFLPEVWNGRFAAVGNGGMAGGINWMDMAPMVKYGFAVTSTDTGHNGTSVMGEWAMRGNETLADNAWRAMHGTVVRAKQVVQGHYAANISFSYYNGCSTGGRQGLVEVQRFPEDFDGVLAGSPGWEAAKGPAWVVQMGAFNQPNTSAHHIPPAKYALVQAEAIRQCDIVDGVQDGIISDVEGCFFRPETLLCRPGQNTSLCLNGEQINTLHLLYGDYTNLPQPMFFYPVSVGSEVGWAGTFPAYGPLDLGVNMLKYENLQDPSFNWKTDLNYTLVQRLNNPVAKSYTPDAFDITPFARRGGKLLHYHGLSDSLIPWQSSRRWYESVYRNITSQRTDIAIDDFYRMFFIPGMRHCGGANGDAPWYIGADSQPFVLGSDVYSVPGFMDADHDAVLSLMRWVEQGVAPNWIVATKFLNETVASGVRRQRTLCPYPKRARLTGTNVDSATSWVC